MNFSGITIIPLAPEKYPDFLSHLGRHIVESGQSGNHFMPFAPGHREPPTSVAGDKLNLAIDQKGWQRCCIGSISVPSATTPQRERFI